MGKKVKSILYFSAVDWAWIYQRPQILADGLSNHYNISVVFPRSIIKRWKSQKNKHLDYHKKIIHIFPKQDKIFFLSKFYDLQIRNIFKNVNSFDAVWISSPLLYKYLPETYEGKIIYDCMDNYFELEKNSKCKAEIQIFEAKLIHRADLVIVSSLYLMNKIDMKYSYKVHLIRNGFLREEMYPISDNIVKEQYKIGYFGTISEWFDFDIIHNSLCKFKCLNYYLIGPNINRDRYTNPNVFYEGVVEHKDLYTKVEKYDCLIMPFLINDIVLAVDPVKLYEYISFGKCIISVYYPEIKQFEDFVYFYSNSTEYNSILEDLINNGFKPKYSQRQQNVFLNKNSWDNRINETYTTINKHL